MDMLEGDGRAVGRVARRMISLFSGAGGMDIGLHMAGFSTAVAVEMDPSCCATLRKNMPGVPVLEGDLFEVSSEEILSHAGMMPLDADLVAGGPPCQGFSLAGKRMGMDEPRGMLVLEFLRVVRDTLPKAFIMENVKGMVSWSQGKALDAILEEAARPIEYAGAAYSYDVTYKVLNSADYGVPQFRERIFIVGNRVGRTFAFPGPTHADPKSPNGGLPPWKTAGDAIGTLPPASPPSQAAIRTSLSIKGRIENHGY